MEYPAPIPSVSIDRGREAIKYFHNQSCIYPGYELSMDELILKISPENSTLFLNTFGDLIIRNEMSSSDVQEAMISLANKGQGKIPEKFQYFFTALSDQVQNFSFIEAAKYVSVETVKDVGAGFQQIGSAVLDTGKSLLVIGPIVIVAAVLFVVYGKSKRLAG